MKKFIDRHVGPSANEVQKMLEALNLESLDALIDQTVPSSIRLEGDLDILPAQSEHQYLGALREIAVQNDYFKSYIGQGYYATITPSPILRNVFQNPGWYTQYTPYQAEIAQGRLEALLNFQTLISDLTAMPIANASLLDEGTAAAEAMTMFHGIKNKRSNDRPTILVDKGVFPQTIEVLYTRAAPLGIEIRVGNWQNFVIEDDVFAALVQYPNDSGAIENYRKLSQKLKEKDANLIVAADLLALTMITPPGEWGADAVVGNTQRFGVPMGFGGPHAAYFATLEKYKRQIPGRIIGVSVDADGKPALRMALQTREQHIRREKATSNICTAQALLAVMASMYAVDHGPQGLKNIAEDIARKTKKLAVNLQAAGYQLIADVFFDTVAIQLSEGQIGKIRKRALSAGINLHYTKKGAQISLGEGCTNEELNDLLQLFDAPSRESDDTSITQEFTRSSPFLTHPVFHQHQTETKLMRYIKQLENKDLSLTHAMIPLGSCTMKLNAATQLMPVSWDIFANIHPFVPEDQVKGYLQVIDELARDLCEITGFSACSFQPNSGAQGEYAGLLAIRAYHQANGDHQRTITLIPSSAHGTNPASAVMAGMKVVIVACDEQGNIDLTDLRAKVQEHQEQLGALMVTYPSTHGVFEEDIKEICDQVHAHGGMVYMDGANMNAQVGITNPALIGADVCHLNLHKTFAIPHGGGGPGMGPICVNESLAPYLAGHIYSTRKNSSQIRAVASAPFGSASILLISYAYIKLLGADGLKRSTEIAILNANYLRARLSDHYPVLYLGKNGYSAHELILDLRPFKNHGIDAEDVAKRLIDYGFHAPTLSFPVAGTLMIEPTESEDLEELDRFCEAMIQIKEEIDEVVRGDFSTDSNVLVHAPHTIASIADDAWTFPYSREKAVFPLPWLKTGHKFWPSVRRVNNAHGDRTLICTCPPIESYMEGEV